MIPGRCLIKLIRWFGLLVATTAIMQIAAMQNSKSQYIDPTYNTNTNKIDPLFETNLNDYRQLEQGAEDSMNKALEGLKGNEGFDSLPGHDKAQAEAARLSDISHQDLHGKGMGASMKESWMNEIFIDYSRPGNSIYLQNAEEIASRTGDMMGNILDKLKDIGVDCRAVKGNEIKEPGYVIELKSQEVKDTVYDKVTCEELRNRYACRDTLSVRCTSSGTKSLKVTPIGIQVNPDGNGGMWVGWPACNSHFGGWGKIYHYAVKFDIENPDNVTEFSLRDLSYDDYVLFRINGNHVWSGPVGGHRLELHGHTVIVDDGGRGYGAERNRWNVHHDFYLNLKPHLKKGENVLNITLVVGGYGSVIFYLKATEKSCDRWQEEWNEKCHLN